jgi:Acyltransferase family.
VSLMFYGVQWVAIHFFSQTRKEKPHQVRHDNKKAEKTESVSKLFIAVFAIISLAGGWILYKNHIRLPLGIERDLTVLFFFACGWLSKDPIRNRLCVKGKKSIPWSLAVATSITAFILYATFEVPDPNFSIMNNDLGKDLRIFVASSVFGIAGLIGAFVLADKLPNATPVRIIKGILRNISRNALIILAVHWYTLLVMRLLFKPEINRPGIAYLAIPIVIAVVIGAIPLFRCKLYRLLGKPRATLKESLDIKS